MNKFIKTECGLNKYEDLKSSKTFFGRVRFYWFVLIASLRDKILKLKRFLNYRGFDFSDIDKAFSLIKK